MLTSSEEIVHIARVNKENPIQHLYPCSRIRAFAFQIKSLDIPVSILHKSIAGRYRPVRLADGPITARYRFM